MQADITKSGVYLHVQLMKNGHRYYPDNVREIMQYFTICTNTIGQTFLKTTQYKLHHDKNLLRIPRFGFHKLRKSKKGKRLGLGKAKISNKIKPCKTINFDWKGKMTHNQQVVHKYIMEEYYTPEKVKTGESGLILNMEAGQGKSFLAMGLIATLKQPTLIVVHNTNLLRQWYKILTATFPDATIGQYYGVERTDGDIIVGTIHSLNKSKMGFRGEDPIPIIDFFKKFGFVVFDECHEYCGRTFSRIFTKAQSTYMLGLSATPDERSDKFDKVAWWGCGPIVVAANIKNYNTLSDNFDGRVEMIKYFGPDSHTEILINESTGLVCVPQMIQQVTEDTYRSSLICQYITASLKDKEKNIFVFADRRAYLIELKEVLEIYGVEADMLEKVSNLMGGAKDSEVEHAEKHARVILTTYGYMGTGKSIPKMNTVILATPRKSKCKQYVNRIFRLGSDETITRNIVDIVDWRTTLKNQWYKRRSYYIEKGYPITEIKVEYDAINKHDFSKLSAPAKKKRKKPAIPEKKSNTSEDKKASPKKEIAPLDVNDILDDL